MLLYIDCIGRVSKTWTPSVVSKVSIDLIMESIQSLTDESSVISSMTS